MTLGERLQPARIVFLDTAPIIYHVERNSRYALVVADLFALLDAREIIAITSPITLAESIVAPLKTGNREVVRLFERAIVSGRGMRFVPIDRRAATLAAEFRAQYGLSLTDALQLAVAMDSRCGAFVTNDATFRRVGGIDVVILDDFLSPR